MSVEELKPVPVAYNIVFMAHQLMFQINLWALYYDVEPSTDDNTLAKKKSGFDTLESQDMVSLKVINSPSTNELCADTMACMNM